LIAGRVAPSAFGYPIQVSSNSYPPNAGGGDADRISLEEYHLRIH
jgi:hypothetical protein